GPPTTSSACARRSRSLSAACATGDIFAGGGGALLERDARARVQHLEVLPALVSEVGPREAVEVGSRHQEGGVTLEAALEVEQVDAVDELAEARPRVGVLVLVVELVVPRMRTREQEDERDHDVALVLVEAL